MSGEQESGPDYFSPEMRRERLREIIEIFSDYVASLDIDPEERAEMILEFRDGFDCEGDQFGVLAIRQDKKADAHDLPPEPLFSVAKDDQDMLGAAATVLAQRDIDVDEFLAFLLERGFSSDANADTSYQNP